MGFKLFYFILFYAIFIVSERKKTREKSYTFYFIFLFSFYMTSYNSYIFPSFLSLFLFHMTTTYYIVISRFQSNQIKSSSLKYVEKKRTHT